MEYLEQQRRVKERCKSQKGPSKQSLILSLFLKLTLWFSLHFARSCSLTLRLRYRSCVRALLEQSPLTDLITVSYGLPIYRSNFSIEFSNQLLYRSLMHLRIMFCYWFHRSLLLLVNLLSLCCFSIFKFIIWLWLSDFFGFRFY